MADSPPPSPASILKAQLIVEEAKLANLKLKKAKKNSTMPAKFKRGVKKERVEDSQEGDQESDKENAESSDGIKSTYNFSKIELLSYFGRFGPKNPK